jgi:lantibiotic biosynthesis protein
MDRQPQSLIDEVFAGLAESAISSQGLTVWANSPVAGMPAEPIGSDLYSGTAGMAFAFAAYAQFSGHDWAYKLSRQAMRYALKRSENIDRSIRHGFYTGWPGIFYSSAFVGLACNAPEIMHQASHLLDALRNETGSSEVDIMGGQAGAVAGLALTSTTDLDTAIGAAERLRRSAIMQDRPWAPSDSRLGRLPLTGFSHGCAGISWALLELFARTESETWRELANMGFRYEDSLFDSSAHNWPDLRYYANWKATRLRPPVCQAYWCHGAGGIALSRVRAFEITNDPAYLNAVETAIGTLAKATERSLEDPEISLSLCHGLAGNVDAIWRVEETTTPNKRSEIAKILAEQLANRLASHLEYAHEPFEPGLMLGIAGSALSLMRTLKPGIPTPLLPPPQIQ